MMGSLLGPLLANVFMCSIEDKLDQDGKLPSYYRRYVDDTFTIMPDIASAEIFLDTLNHCHPSAKFTMEVERNASLPFIGVELLNLAPRIKTKVYVKPTNTGLLLHYQSHVDNRYKCSLITTMLDRAYRISSDWSYFSQECDRLETVFLKLKYPRHLFNLAVKQFVHSKVADQQQIPTTDEPHSLVNLPIPENLVITWPYTDRPPTVRPHHKKTNVYCHILASLGAQEKTNCTSMLWSIDSCQNRVSADQYHLTVPRAQVSTHRGRVLFWSYPLTNYQFQMIAGSSLFFPMIHMKYVVFMSLWPRTIKILISNRPGTGKFNLFFKKKNMWGWPFLTMVTRWSRSTSNVYVLIGQNLTGEFMRKIYAASWKLFIFTAEADRVLCQLLMFLTVFFHWMYKMK